jgi:acyl carrier protein
MFEEVRSLLGDVLKLGPRTLSLRPDTPLMGDLPELDSMAVVAVITELERRYGFTVHDDEISGDTFATVDSLVRFVERKVAR